MFLTVERAAFLFAFPPQGLSFGIIPGGFQEATLSKLGTDRVWMKNRKGLIKVLYFYRNRAHSSALVFFGLLWSVLAVIALLCSSLLYYTCLRYTCHMTMRVRY